jgi:hypothetical protein
MNSMYMHQTSLGYIKASFLKNYIYFYQSMNSMYEQDVQ